MRVSLAARGLNDPLPVLERIRSEVLKALGIPAQRIATVDVRLDLPEVLEGGSPVRCRMMLSLDDCREAVADRWASHWTKAIAAAAADLGIALDWYRHARRRRTNDGRSTVIHTLPCPPQSA